MSGSLYALASPPDGALEIEDRIVGRCQRINSELRQLFSDIAEFDRREAWRADGAHSMAHWLQMMTGASERTSKEWVTAAHALDSLPKISSALDEGRLSWDQLRPLASFATPEEDEQLAGQAPGWSAAALEEEARRRRRITRDEAGKVHADRFFKRRWDRDSGTLRVWGQLPYDQGAVVEKTLNLMAQQARAAGVKESLGALRADTLTELCSSWVAGQKDADRATIVVHVEARELAAVRGMGELENGVVLAAETVRRVSCDGRVQMVVWSEDGEPLGVGRKVRLVPQWLMRLVRHRDKGCRFPECGRAAWTDAHHIIPWCRGGRTDLDNLCLLCGYHHTLVHEGGWKIDGAPDGELQFIPPLVRPIVQKQRRRSARGP